MTLLIWSDPRNVRIVVGIFLVAYSLYAFFRPAVTPVTVGGRADDAIVGFFNGVLAGLTGLAGILVTIWCGLRGWPKDVLRAIFQPVAVAIFLMSAMWLGARGTVTADTIKFFAMGLPFLFVGTWLDLGLGGRCPPSVRREPDGPDRALRRRQPGAVRYLRSSRSLVTLAFRGVPIRRELFADILRVDVPDLINVTITNLSVVLLTGIAGRLGSNTAIGYAIGARLEYILIPLAFGFGTAIVAMVRDQLGRETV